MSFVIFFLLRFRFIQVCSCTRWKRSRCPELRGESGLLIFPPRDRSTWFTKMISRVVNHDQCNQFKFNNCQESNASITVKMNKHASINTKMFQYAIAFGNQTNQTLYKFHRLTDFWGSNNIFHLDFPSSSNIQGIG